MHRRRASNCRIVVPTHDDDDDDARDGVGEGEGGVATGVGVVPTRDDDDDGAMTRKREDMCVRSMTTTTTTRARASLERGETRRRLTSAPCVSRETRAARDRGRLRWRSFD